MKKKSIYIILIIMVFFLVNSAVQKPLMAGQSKINFKTEEGLHIVMFGTPNGKINVNLPDDTARGDVISGTVVAYPAGKTKKELAKNQDVLNGYAVEINEQKTPTIKKLGKWIIKAEFS